MLNIEELKNTWSVFITLESRNLYMNLAYTLRMSYTDFATELFTDALSAIKSDINAADEFMFNYRQTTKDLDCVKGNFYIPITISDELKNLCKAYHWQYMDVAAYALQHYIDTKFKGEILTNPKTLQPVKTYKKRGTKPKHTTIDDRQ